MARPRVILFGIPLLLVLAGYGIDRFQLCSPLREAVHEQSVSCSLLRYGTLGDVLRRCHLITAVPDAKSQDASVPPRVDPLQNIFQKKSQPSKYRFVPHSGSMEGLPSSRVIDSQELTNGAPVISLVVEPERLETRKPGRLKKVGRGKSGEALAYVSYYEGGALLFSTACGIRPHALHRNGLRGYRLYFRNKYGLPVFPSSVLTGLCDEPIETLVVRVDRLLTTALSFDITRQMGALAPPVKSARLFMNGEFIGLVSLTGHLGRRQLRQALGHSNYYCRKYKDMYAADEASSQAYQKLREFLADLDPMTLKAVEEHVDLDNMSRHLLSLMFCGTTDWRQGYALYDHEVPDPRWFWVNWDMDHSFLDLAGSHIDKTRPPWRQEAVDLVATYRRWWRNEDCSKRDLRSVMFIGLCEQSPGYRDRFARIAFDLLNHKVTGRFLADRMDFYRRQSEVLGASDSLLRSLREKQDFVEHRADFLRTDLQQHLNLAELYTVKVSGPDGVFYDIDSYPEGPGYSGTYFGGQPFTIRVQSAEDRRFSHWLINGEVVSDPQLSRAITGHTQIESVWM